MVKFDLGETVQLELRGVKVHQVDPHRKELGAFNKVIVTNKRIIVVPPLVGFFIYMSYYFREREAKPGVFTRRIRSYSIGEGKFIGEYIQLDLVPARIGRERTRIMTDKCRRVAQMLKIAGVPRSGG